MQCPTGDGELIAHTTYGEHNLTVSYSTCSLCNGYWMDSFAANFISLPPDSTLAEAPLPTSPPKCPVCTRDLARATGDNIPDTVLVYTCPDNHGYFFPAGQLAAFKKAQKTKIEYHKLWNVPLPGVKSVLLAGLLVLILAGGLIAGLRSVQNRQTTTSEAQGLLTQRTYVNSGLHDVLFTAETQYDAAITLHIPSLTSFEKALNTNDNRIHTLTVKNIPSGSYGYFYTISVGGEEVQSEAYSFVMP